MRLKELLNDIEVINADQEILEAQISDIVIDHRKVKPGDVFVALRGTMFDGNDFVVDALEAGARAVVTESLFDDPRCVIVQNARKAYAVMSKHYFGDACDHLRIVAITGTNGKTTTCQTIASVLRTAGAKVGTIGTLGATVDDKAIDTGFTTPDPYLLHKIFLQMKESREEFVIMEASAHALALDKLEGINFEIGVLTNVTEDHLDFFENMENYARAKFKLFESGRLKLGIVCEGKDYVDKLKMIAGVPLITYGIDLPADVLASGCKLDFSQSHFRCVCLGETFDVSTSLVGDCNVENALASIAVCRSLGLSPEIIQFGLRALEPVEGRFNVIKMNGLNIIIDFAHTPDGLEKVLKSARELTSGRLIVVFGCGGNRDKKKRPIMGQIASSLADEVVLTSDNPRFENPRQIIEEIRAGVTGKCKTYINRKRAIEQTLKTHHNGETIVIAGKGGERYQSVMGRDFPYNDFDTVYNFFRRNIRVLPDQQTELR